MWNGYPHTEYEQRSESVSTGQNSTRPLLLARTCNIQRLTHHIIYTTEHCPEIMKLENLKDQAQLKATLCLKCTKINILV